MLWRLEEEVIEMLENSKFLLIVAELELIFAWCCGGNIWETL